MKVNARKVIVCGIPLALFVALFLFLALWKWNATVIIAGKKEVVQASGLTVGQVLRSASIAVESEDKISPSLNHWVMFSHPTIEIERAVQVLVIDNGKTYTILTIERKPETILASLKLSLASEDQLLVDGMIVDAKNELPERDGYILQIRRAIPITLQQSQAEQTFSSTAATLGQALWQKGLRTLPEDAIAPDLETPLIQPLTVSLKKAVLLDISVDGKEVQALSSASTVGDALADAGISLQNLDYSEPAETASIPADDKISVTREREEVTLQQTKIPYTVAYQQDPDTPLDQTRLVQAGAEGIQVTRVRVLYKNGAEVSRQTEAQWQAQAPQKEIIGYGTKVTIQTAVVDGVTISYWRSVRVYATSYSPCRQGYDTCSDSTTSGATLKKGIISVIPSWYNQMAGEDIYVTGYGTGTIADTGGGISGENWIDLGYSESDFINWHSWVEIYFLTPVPSTIPWILP